MTQNNTLCLLKSQVLACVIMKVVIAGASGFIGSALSAYFLESGEEVVPLSHRKNWDPITKKIDLSLLEGSDVVINLAGETILGRWTERKMASIRESRLLTTAFLTESLLQLKDPPKLYIGASGVGYYGDRGEEKLTEKSSQGSGFTAELCRDWEKIPTKLTGCRVVAARFGVVLGKGGGAIQKMIPPFRLGLGGVFGSGKQIMSWIAIEDLVGAIDHIIKTETLSGPINFVAPHTVTNRDLTKTLGKVLHRPTFFRLPKWLLGLIFGPGASNFLASTDVQPERLLESGYHFQYPDIERAIQKIICE